MPSIYFRLLSLLLLCAGISSYGQNTPVLSQTQPDGTADTITLPPAFAVPDTLNYMRSYVPRMPINDAAQLTKTAAASVTTAATVYRDGFNRDMESVQHRTLNSGAGSLVVPADSRFRRDGEAYLPYAHSEAYGFRQDAFREQKNYYSALYPGEGGVSYSQSKNDNGSGRRSVLSFAPGKSQAGQSRGTGVSHIANDAFAGIEGPAMVRMWSLDGSGYPVSSGWYPADQLFGEKVEQKGFGGTFYTFTDRDGRLVCKVQYLEDVTLGEAEIAVYARTYYVYDEQGRLRWVLPPKATLYSPSGTVSSDVRHNLCFAYQYDSRGRLSGQRDPGQEGMTEVVYDYLDRPVMRRTPLEAQRGQWEVTYYDPTGRVAATSLYADTTGRNTWQNLMDSGIGSSYPGDLSFYLLPADGQIGPPGTDAVAGNTMMSYSYYDNYAASDYASGRFNNMTSALAFGEFQYSEGYEIPERSLRTHGLLTSSKVRILPSPNADTALTGDWREQVLYYDDKGRVIYTLSEDYYHGNLVHYDYTGNEYNFSGQLLVTKHILGNLNAAGAQVHTELLQNEYEWATGRLQRSSHKVDGSAWKTLAVYTYDELGRLNRKNLGNGAEAQDRSYNIRGQLTGINGVYAETGNKEGASRSFGESLKYDYGFSMPRYDGKISGMVWRGAGSGAKANAYGYDYDMAGRLKSADYRRLESVSPAFWSKAFADYSVAGIRYDRNGNLQRMDQKGVQPGTGIVDMDRLYYTYEAGDLSNRLLRVVDSAAFPDLGDFNNTNGSDDDYGYDVNGNLQHDHNKLIGDVSYTHFNKPSSISGDEGQTTEYSYDAAGSKVQELLISESGTTRTDYIGNAVYRNDTILYLQTAEGRTVLDSGSVYPVTEEFFVKDHLGNVRSRVNLISYSMNEYLATYEVASAYLEGLYFGQMDEIRDNRPGSTDSADAKSGNLNGGDPDRRIGSTLLVKVMAGDKISMSVNSYYSGYDSEEDDPKPAETMLTSVLGALTGGIGGYVGSESHEVKTAQSLFTETNFEDFDLLVQSLTDPTKPRAYLNYLFFNESMALVGTMSGAFQANGDGIWSQIGTTEALEIPENGFMAVYLSNASMNTGCLACSNVYFDQLSVQITKGNLLEENHYYPFGLPIKTMSSVASGALANRHKYQGNEYKQEQGLNWMDFQARQYDPQLGRFLSVDPLAGSGGQEIFSPYAAMGNAPESMVDPNGEAFESAGSRVLRDGYNLNAAVGGMEAGNTGFGNPNVKYEFHDFKKGYSSKQERADRVQAIVRMAILADGATLTFNEDGNLSSYNQGSSRPAVNNIESQIGNNASSTAVGVLSSGSGGGDNSTDWKLLYKSDLQRYYQLTHLGVVATDQQLGDTYEQLLDADSRNNNRGLIRNRQLFTGGDRNTIPDFTGDMHGVMTDKGYRTVSGANWFELKAKGGGLYLSSNTYQMKGHIDNLVREFGSYSKIYSGFKPIMTLVTTADVRYSFSIKVYAERQNVTYQHIWSEYRIVNGTWQFRFGRQANW